MGKPILCVDFDGVIHSYASGWKGEDIVADPPTPGALRWLVAANEHWDVQIYSSRSKSQAGRDAMRLWLSIHAERELGPEIGQDLLDVITFAAEKPAAFLTIDDRAVCFEGDWDELDPKALLGFKPWNKRV